MVRLVLSSLSLLFILCEFCVYIMCFMLLFMCGRSVVLYRALCSSISFLCLFCVLLLALLDFTFMHAGLCFVVFVALRFALRFALIRLLAHSSSCHEN